MIEVARGGATGTVLAAVAKVLHAHTDGRVRHPDRVVVVDCSHFEKHQFVNRVASGPAAQLVGGDGGVVQATHDPFAQTAAGVIKVYHIDSDDDGLDECETWPGATDRADVAVIEFGFVALVGEVSGQHVGFAELAPVSLVGFRHA